MGLVPRPKQRTLLSAWGESGQDTPCTQNQRSWEGTPHADVIARGHQLHFHQLLSTAPPHPMSRGVGKARALRAKGLQGKQLDTQGQELKTGHEESGTRLE